MHDTGPYVSSSDWLRRLSLGQDPVNPPKVGEVMCGEALEKMALLPARSVGAVVTDPPTFNTHNWMEEPDQGVGPIDLATQWATTFALEFLRVTRPGGAIVTMVGTSQASAAWMIAAEIAGLSWMAEIAVLWDHDTPKSHFGSLCTRILWFAAPGASTWSADRRSVKSNVVVCRRIPVEERHHPGQKPVELTNFLISLLTKEGDTVLDPFCGSGSTLVSAAICERNWVGIDADPAACEWARRRTRNFEAEAVDMEEIRMWINSETDEAV